MKSIAEGLITVIKVIAVIITLIAITKVALKLEYKSDNITEPSVVKEKSKEGILKR